MHLILTNAMTLNIYITNRNAVNTFLNRLMYYDSDIFLCCLCLPGESDHRSSHVSRLTYGHFKIECKNVDVLHVVTIFIQF